MTDFEIEQDKGRPWLLAVGCGLAVAAGALWWWSRRGCDCEHEEGAERPATAFQVGRWMEKARETVTGTSEAVNGAGRTVVDPLAWDTHAEAAWGATPAGPRRLDDFAVADEVEADELN